MKALTVLLGLPAALVVGVITLFTLGEVQGVVFLAAWLALTFVSVAMLPRPALVAVILIQVIALAGGGAFIGDQATRIIRALTTTEGPADPPDAGALASAEQGIDTAMGQAGFRLVLHEDEITAMIQDGLAESDAPLRRVTIDISDTETAGVGRIDFVGEFKSGDLTVEGSVETTIDAGAVQVEVVSLEMGALNLPGIGQNAMEEAIDSLLEQVADVNELLADAEAEVQSITIGDDRIVITGVHAAGVVVTSETLLAGIQQQAAAAAAVPPAPQPRIPPGTVEGTSAEGSSYYVALGDSLAANVGVDRASRGYVSRFHRWLSERDGTAYGLRNFGVSGETSGSLIRGGQLDEAISFIQSNPVGWVTVDIGANDLLGHLGSDDCSADLASAACTARIESTRASYARNIDEIFATLREAAPDATIVFLRAYNPFSIGLGVGFEQQSSEVLDRFNDLAADAAARHGVVVADGFTPMEGTTGSTTHMLDDPPDIHPVAIGYDVLAAALADAVS
jgi:lysophospholipase L1-like esterase